MLDPTIDVLIFQQMSIDWYMNQDPTPIIRIYGVTVVGNSVLCRVHGFLPYAHFVTPVDFVEEDLPRSKNVCASILEKTVQSLRDQRRSIHGYSEDASFIKVTLGNQYKLSE